MKSMALALPENAQQANASVRKYNCLIVDDDEDDKILIEDFLSDAVGCAFEIDWRKSFCAAEESLIDKNDYDVCFIDYRIGAGNGVEFIDAMRQMGVLTPMILMTSVGSSDIDLAAADAGAFYYIEKSHFSTELLMRSVRYAVKLAEGLHAHQKATVELQSNFIANMSHELRTPLHAIIGFAELINQEMAGPIGSQDYVEFATAISKGGKQLLDIVNKIILLGELRSGKRKPKLAAASVEDIAKSAIQKFAKRHPERGVDFSGLRQVERERSAYDAVLLDIAIGELLSNAAKFSEPDTPISVSIDGRHMQYVELTVADKGVGMTADFIGECRKEFSQNESSLSKEHGGIGIGLTIVDLIVRLHKGALTIESEPKVGAAVKISLPV